MRWIGITLIALSRQVDAKKTVPRHRAKAPPVIVAFGDSLTSGPGLRPDQTYPALLQQRIAGEGRDTRW